LINQKEYPEKERDGKTSKAFAEEKQNEFYLSLFQLGDSGHAFGTKKRLNLFFISAYISHGFLNNAFLFLKAAVRFNRSILYLHLLLFTRRAEKTNFR